MKQLVMLGLTALTALMAMAFAGASLATAETTALCAADEEPCALGNTVTHVHEASTSIGRATLLSSLTVECDVLFLGDTSVALASNGPVVIIGTYTYTSCGSCTVEEQNGPSEIKVLKLGHETADATGEVLVHVECNGFISCAFNGVGLKGTTKGPLLAKKIKIEKKEVTLNPNGETSVQEQALSKEAGGFLCPSTAKLDVTTTPLEPVYVSR